jgi:phage FluMu protein Com
LSKAGQRLIAISRNKNVTFRSESVHRVENVYHTYFRSFSLPQRFFSNLYHEMKTGVGISTMCAISNKIQQLVFSVKQIRHPKCKELNETTIYLDINSGLTVIRCITPSPSHKSVAMDITL